MKIDIIAGARPNFMKIAPIIKELEKVKGSIQYRLIHTGQHYDEKMSGSFFKQLGIPQPHINLEVGSGTQAFQTAKIMERYEEVLIKDKSDYCLVVGDVTSTMACAIVAKKLLVKVIHVEGGIRSNDETMPEEINRMVTDAITDIFYTTSEVANQNLIKLGHAKSKIVFVGNTMIDTLLQNIDQFRQPDFYNQLKLTKNQYFVLTLHRPHNVDDKANLTNLIKNIVEGAQNLPIIFPVHPRTKKQLEDYKIAYANLFLVEPQGYLEFNFLVKNAMGVITDSGGITEETTVMGVPCLTLRDNTERPETVSFGTNELIGSNPQNLYGFMDKIIKGQWKKGVIPELWDGKTSQRIVQDLIARL
jgi:UDP-N-acetylglucosamine 2-epimerase (non-hydrolysing)